MVRRRKQLKPSGGDKNPYESTMTINSCLDTRSPLVALPVEIQGIIASHVSTPLRNAIHMYGGYPANTIAIACSISRSQSPLLYVQDLECGCSPYTLPHHRVESSATMESAPFARKAPRVFIGRPQAYQMPEDCHSTISSRR